MAGEAVVKYLNYAINGYKIKKTNNKYHQDAKLEEDLKTDVFLYKDLLEAKDYKDIVKKSVGICNGLLYRQVAADNGIYMMGAGSGCLNTTTPSFGILDFSSVGTIELLPMTRDMFIEYIPGSQMMYDIYVQLPEKYAGYSALFSIGGFLYYEGSIVTRVSATLFKISVTKMNIVRKLHEARIQGFDVSTLSLTTFDNCKDVLLEELTTDEFLYSYFTHLTSFIILQKTQKYTVEKEIMINVKYPGKYVVEHLPIYPVVSVTGMVPNYHRHYIDNRYVLNTDIRPISNKLYTTAKYKEATRLSYTADAYRPRYYPDAYELIIKYDV